DQKDDVIKTVLGNRIYGWSYEKGLYLPMPQKVTVGQPPEPYWTFLDALGNPVPHAKVEIYLKDRRSQILLGKEMLGEKGQLKKTLCRGNSNAYTNSSQPPARFSFKVSHRLYGTAIVQPWGGDHARLVFLPAVPPGTEADRRSIWGVVVDPNGRAVKAAFVKGGGLLPPGAKWVGDIRTQRHGVLTDESGRFRMYLPPAEDAIQVGALIPPNTQYSIRIEPPEGSNLSDFTGRVMNGRSTTITLKRKQQYHRTFAFEDEGGPITDTQSLRGIDITIERTDQSNLYLHYDEFKNGGRYPLGTYKARSGPNKSYRFQPIKVTADSPEELVFRIAPAKTYYGRIVNGVTGQPMAGAFVIASGGYAERKNLSYLTAGQWDALHALSASDPASDPNIKEALKPVTDCYSVIKMVRADRDGWFRLTEPPKVTVRDIVVFEEGHLTINVLKRWAKPDDEGNHRFGDIRLFPAAMVLVEPIDGQGTYRRWPLRFRPQWFLAAKKNPAWVQDLLAACEKHPENGIRREFWLEADRQHCFQVPAGLNLRIHLRVMGNIEWAQITIADNLRLDAGEVFDAGQVKIGPPFKVFVKVLNSQGAPVEAIPVVVCGQHDPVISSSDENGFAFFDFVGYSKGEFIVEHKPADDADAALRQVLPYEVKGLEDVNSIYTMTLSDQLLKGLAK
ncbi:MAG: carboxypeptidase-like regulatory domain-containing protein, partial [Planctomycetota bacterium]